MPLSKVQEFTSLKTILTASAYNVMENFSLTEQNYDSCTEILKNGYRKADLVVNACMNNLLKLNPVRNSSNLHALRKSYDTCKVNVRNLNILGVSSTSYGHLLIPMLLKVLPQVMVIEFH